MTNSTIFLATDSLGPLDRPEDVTGNAVPVREIEGWLHLTAKRLAIGAARMKSATGRRIDGTGHIPLQDDAFLLPARLGHRHGRKERPCIRVFSIPVNGFTGGDFDDLAQVHNRHAMADVFDDAQIMRDKK